MKRMVVAMALALVSLGNMFAQTVYDFTLVNKTGYEILYVYVSPSDDAEWGDDVLGSEETIANNTRRLIQFDETYAEVLNDFGVNNFDIKAVDEDGDEMIFENIPLKRVNTIELSWRNGTGTATFR